MVEPRRLAGWALALLISVAMWIGLILVATAIASPPPLARLVRRHESRQLHVPARIMHVTCTGRACRVRWCWSLGSVSVNGGPFRPLPPVRWRETVTVAPRGAWRYSTLAIGGACR